MGNQCCDKQSKYLKGDQTNTKIFDQNDKQIPPSSIPIQTKNNFHKAAGDSITSNGHSKEEQQNNRQGYYASITPPSIKGHHPSTVWNKLENGSNAPTEFFASNFGWKESSSGSAHTGARSSIKFSYSNGNKSVIKSGLNPVQEIPDTKMSRFGSQYNNKSAFKKNDKVDQTV